MPFIKKFYYLPHHDTKTETDILPPCENLWKLEGFTIENNQDKSNAAQGSPKSFQDLPFEEQDKQMNYKKILGILNKMTSVKLQKLIMQMGPELMDEVHSPFLAEMIFTKALSDNMYVNLYARLCDEVSSSLSTESLESFNQRLQSLCFGGFDHLLQLTDHDIQGIHEDVRYAFKRRLMNMMRFIGEMSCTSLPLFKRGSNWKMIDKLISTGEEIHLEAVYFILYTISIRSSDNAWPKRIEECVKEVSNGVMNGKGVSPRIKFCFMSLTDLKQGIVRKFPWEQYETLNKKQISVKRVIKSSKGKKTKEVMTNSTTSKSLPLSESILSKCNDDDDSCYEDEDSSSKYDDSYCGTDNTSSDTDSDLSTLGRCMDDPEMMEVLNKFGLTVKSNRIKRKKKTDVVKETVQPLITPTIDESLTDIPPMARSDSHNSSFGNVSNILEPRSTKKTDQNQPEVKDITDSLESENLNNSCESNNFKVYRWSKRGQQIFCPDVPKNKIRFFGEFSQILKTSNLDLLRFLKEGNPAAKVNHWKIIDRYVKNKKIAVVTFSIDRNLIHHLRIINYMVVWKCKAVSLYSLDVEWKVYEDEDQINLDSVSPLQSSDLNKHLAKSENNDKCTNLDNYLEVAFKLVDLSKETSVYDRLKSLEKFILEQSQNYVLNNPHCGISFNGFCPVDNHLVVFCTNEESLRWLNNLVFSDSDIIIKSFDIPLISVKGFFPNLDVSLNDDYIVEELSKSNDNITKTWKLFKKSSLENGTLLTFLIDAHSAHALLKKNNKIISCFLETTYVIHFDWNQLNYNTVSVSSNEVDNLNRSDTSEGFKYKIDKTKFKKAEKKFVDYEPANVRDEVLFQALFPVKPNTKSSVIFKTLVSNNRQFNFSTWRVLTKSVTENNVVLTFDANRNMLKQLVPFDFKLSYEDFSITLFTMSQKPWLQELNLVEAQNKTDDQKVEGDGFKPPVQTNNSNTENDAENLNLIRFYGEFAKGTAMKNKLIYSKLIDLNPLLGIDKWKITEKRCFKKCAFVEFCSPPEYLKALSKVDFKVIWVNGCVALKPMSKQTWNDLISLSTKKLNDILASSFSNNAGKDEVSTSLNASNNQNYASAVCDIPGTSKSTDVQFVGQQVVTIKNKALISQNDAASKVLPEAIYFQGKFMDCLQYKNEEILECIHDCNPDLRALSLEIFKREDFKNSCLLIFKANIDCVRILRDNDYLINFQDIKIPMLPVGKTWHDWGRILGLLLIEKSFGQVSKSQRHPSKNASGKSFGVTPMKISESKLDEAKPSDAIVSSVLCPFHQLSFNGSFPMCSSEGNDEILQTLHRCNPDLHVDKWRVLSRKTKKNILRLEFAADFKLFELLKVINFNVLYNSIVVNLNISNKNFYSVDGLRFENNSNVINKNTHMVQETKDTNVKVKKNERTLIDSMQDQKKTPQNVWSMLDQNLKVKQNSVKAEGSKRLKVALFQGLFPDCVQYKNKEIFDCICNCNSKLGVSKWKIMERRNVKKSCCIIFSGDFNCLQLLKDNLYRIHFQGSTVRMKSINRTWQEWEMLLDPLYQCLVERTVENSLNVLDFNMERQECKVAILPKNFPSILFTEQECSLVKSELSQLLISCYDSPDISIVPKLNNVVQFDGWLLILCFDKQTADWLINLKLEPWEDAEINIIGED